MRKSRAGRTRAFVSELLRLSPDVIFSAGTANLTALLRQAPTVPIVFIQVSDPVAQGFASNLAEVALHDFLATANFKSTSVIDLYTATLNPSIRWRTTQSPGRGIPPGALFSLVEPGQGSTPHLPATQNSAKITAPAHGDRCTAGQK
jgi:hypothetical protein